MKSNVVLRGAGADKTILKFVNGSAGCANGAVVCFESGDNQYQYSIANGGTWTASSYAQGTTQITLTKIVGSPPAVGNLMVLFQADATSDTGTIWNCQGVTSNTCSDENQQGNNGPALNKGGSQGLCSSLAATCSQTQTVTVTAVSGSGPYTVTFTPGLYSPFWSATYSPAAYWSTNAPISNAGLEDVTLDIAAITTSSVVANTLVEFYWATNCWVTGVRTLNIASPPYRNNMWMYQAVHNTIQNNYVYGSNGYDLSYGIESGYATSDNLIYNNILQHTATAEICNGCQGNVWAFNLSVDNYYTAEGTSPNFQQADSYPVHQDGSYLQLFEGNVGSKLVGDAIHGTGWMNTAFRNYWSGRDGVFKTSSTQVVDMESYARYFNLVGNVLGTPGYHTTYKDIPASSTDNTGCNNTGPHSIMTLGWAQGNGCYTGGVLNDVKVAPYLYLWGNYDTVTGGVRWCGNSSNTGWSTTCSSTSEVPTGLSSYAQTVPSTESLPNSFFFSSAPPYWTTNWGTPPWPAIGPDVTGGTGPGGHAYSIPAQLVFSNTAFDSNYASQATISSIAESGTTATMTLGASAPAAFAQYQSFWITGSSVSGYNGLWQVATVSGSTITFTATSGLGSASGGTATANGIHVFNANTDYPSSALSSGSVSPPASLSATVQ